jgi:hypothetical protein
MEVLMLRYPILVAALAFSGAAVAQTPEPVPAPPAATAELPRCSAEVRDRCVQDERFARDVARPGGSRDNNAMAYRTSAAAKKRVPRG